MSRCPPRTQDRRRGSAIRLVRLGWQHDRRRGEACLQKNNDSGGIHVGGKTCEIKLYIRDNRTDVNVTVASAQELVNDVGAIARGLMARPRLLLLDEPTLGLSPRLVKELLAVILDVRDSFGASVLLVEQNAGLALTVAERGYLLQNGRVVASGRSRPSATTT